MHDALTVITTTRSVDHGAAPGWRPPVDRLALGWGEVATGWLAAGGLLAILAVAALINHEPVGGAVVQLAKAQPPGVQLISGDGAAAFCPSAGPAVAAPLAPRPQSRA